jgi:hypothetical protein
MSTFTPCVAGTSISDVWRFCQKLHYRENLCGGNISELYCTFSKHAKIGHKVTLRAVCEIVSEEPTYNANNCVTVMSRRAAIMLLALLQQLTDDGEVHNLTWRPIIPDTDIH